MIFEYIAELIERIQYIIRNDACYTGALVTSCGYDIKIVEELDLLISNRLGHPTREAFDLHISDPDKIIKILLKIREGVS